MPALIEESKINALAARMPRLSGITGISLLEGGLTNKNYKIDTKTGAYVLRVSEGEPNKLGIDRNVEKINTHRAHEAGVGPALIDSIIDEGVLLISWIDARTLHPDDMQNNAALLKKIGAALQMLHSGPAFEGHFHFPSIRKKYMSTVLKNNYFIPDQYLETEPLINALENAIAENPEPLVPCNNDLLAGNFLDDGNHIWIIDYEYSGQNEASFELGNLAAESGLSEKDLMVLCKAYWQEDSSAKVARAQGWSLISRFGWVLWASIQEAVSSIEFDFRAWGMKKWKSVLPEIQSATYHKILETIKKDHS